MSSLWKKINYYEKDPSEEGLTPNYPYPPFDLSDDRRFDDIYLETTNNQYTLPDDTLPDDCSGFTIRFNGNYGWTTEYSTGLLAAIKTHKAVESVRLGIGFDPIDLEGDSLQLLKSIIDSIRENPVIKYLHWDFMVGTDTKQNFQNLKFLDYSRKTVSTLDLHKHLGDLDVDPELTFRLAKCILGMENLRELEIYHVDDENNSLLRAISPKMGLKNLRDFAFSGSTLDVATATAFCERLSQSDSSIRHVSLNFSAVAPETLEILSKNLKKIPDVRVGKFGRHARFLTDLIAGNGKTEILGIGCNMPQDDARIQAIADGLLENETLASLCLEFEVESEVRNDVDSHPNIALLTSSILPANSAASVVSLQNLRVLSQSTMMTDNNCSALCALIRSHGCPLSFLALDIGMNKTQYESILSGVTDSPTIQSFQLHTAWDVSNIEDDETRTYFQNNQHLVYLSEKLPKMSTLLHLQLGYAWDPLSEEVQNRVKNSLLDGIKQNKSLTFVELRDIETWQLAQGLQSYCKRNMIVKAAFALSIGRLPPQVMIKAVETIQQKKVLVVTPDEAKAIEFHSATLWFHGMQGAVLSGLFEKDKWSTKLKALMAEGN